MIRIGQEIDCFPYAGFFVKVISLFKIKKKMIFKWWSFISLEESTNTFTPNSGNQNNFLKKIKWFQKKNPLPVVRI